MWQLALGQIVGRAALDAAAVVGAWILATGFWDDAGVWDDTAVWKDS